MIEDVLTRLADQLSNRYFGKYRGYVHDVTDPMQMGRIRAIVPRLLGDVPTPWAMPCVPYAGPNQGMYTVPEVGAPVWIEFEEGDLSAPIWAGMWWGAPVAADLSQPDSTATTLSKESELPQHGTPPQLAEPGVHVWKSASGHTIVLDDRAHAPDGPHIEIQDASGNRVILSAKGLDELISNQRVVNRGSRGVQVDLNDRLEVGATREQTIKGSLYDTVKGNREQSTGGNYKETVGTSAYSFTVDDQGITEQFGGTHNVTVNGAVNRTVVGALSETVTGGIGLTGGGAVGIASGSAISIAGGVPSPPSPNVISIDGFMGNISINTKLGMLQLGGMSAISPMVLGDGLMMHFTMLSQIMKAVNPLTVAAYGPALDVWAAMTPVIDWSYFGYVKRMPVG